MFQESFQKCINPGIEFAVDEFLAKYYSRGKQRATCPQRYIPRRPHPNGLQLFLGSFKTECSPFIFEIELDFTKYDPVGTRVALMRMLQRWKLNI